MFKFHDNIILVFDDGGLITSNPDGSGFKIDFIVYKKILELAKRNEIKIPIACTASFFDVNGIYDKSIVNRDTEKILQLIQDNKNYLEVWNHGLTHMYKNNYTEFGLFTEEAVDYEVQQQKLSISQKIFRSLGFDVKTFVPPGHAWVQGTTDKIALDQGIENIAIREFEKTPFIQWMKNPSKRYEQRWEKSDFLNTYFRLGLGIAHDQFMFKRKTYYKSNIFVNNTFPLNILSNRTLKLKYPVNHFFSHVQNLMGEDGMDYFNYLIKKIKFKCAE